MEMFSSDIIFQQEINVCDLVVFLWLYCHFMVFNNNLNSVHYD